MTRVTNGLPPMICACCGFVHKPYTVVYFKPFEWIRAHEYWICEACYEKHKTDIDKGYVLKAVGKND